jgi:hypothetical protein
MSTFCLKLTDARVALGRVSFFTAKSTHFFNGSSASLGLLTHAIRVEVSLTGHTAHVWMHLMIITAKNIFEIPAKIPHKYFAKPTIIRIFAVLKNTPI